MNTRILVLATAAVLLLGFTGWWAWNAWPPVGRYRINRNHEAMRAVVAAYFSGRLALDTAARRLADGMQRDMRLGWAVQPESGEGGGNLTAWSLIWTPAGFSPTDPRMAGLEERTMRYFIGSERFDEFQKRVERRMRGESPP